MSTPLSSPSPTRLSPIQQADQARQVVGVLTRMEQRFSSGSWCSGARFLPSGGNCLIGGIDEASEWTMPGVAEVVTRELATRLPQPFRAMGRLRPRLALATFNDTVGGNDGALRLIRAALDDLGVSRRPRPTFVPSPETVAVDDARVTRRVS
jgi:hypothetical protein